MTMVKLSVSFVALSWFTLSAQAPQVRPEFEVASIKPNRSGVSLTTRINPVTFTGNRFTATNVTLVDLIVRVYPTRRIQMEGGRKWIDSERFDIVAKANETEHPLKYADFVPLMQALLESRL